MYINWDNLADSIPLHTWYSVPRSLVWQNGVQQLLQPVDLPASKTVRFPATGLYKLVKDDLWDVSVPRALNGFHLSNSHWEQIVRDIFNHFRRESFEYQFGLAWKEDAMLHCMKEERNRTYYIEEEDMPIFTPHVAKEFHCEEEEGAYIINDF